MPGSRPDLPRSVRLQWLRKQRRDQWHARNRLRALIAEIDADIRALSAAIRDEQDRLATEGARRHVESAAQVLALYNANIPIALIAERLQLTEVHVQELIDEAWTARRTGHAR